MRKLDVLMIKSFMGPFVLTTAVSNFILLIQYMLKYFDDFVGKNLGISVFAELLFYFSLNMLQVALPLGVLVASLMTFGNLGEHFELTAIKSSGISLPRTLRPIFLFILILSVGAFYFNNYAVPAANIKAYSLLYDIKHTKPALDIKAGTFYNGIPNYSIKAKEKLPDGKTLLDVIIYDHSTGRGNKTVILSDSSVMYTILDDRYLKLELYNGNYYSERAKSASQVDQLYRTKYHRMDMVFSLASFDLKRRKEELFRNNRQMKNISELTAGIDSFSQMGYRTKQAMVYRILDGFKYHAEGKRLEMEKRQMKRDSIFQYYRNRYQSASFFPVDFLEQKLPRRSKRKLLNLQNMPFYYQKEPVVLWEDTVQRDTLATIGVLKKNRVLLDTIGWHFLEKKINKHATLHRKTIISYALNQARQVKGGVRSAGQRLYKIQKNKNLYTIEKYKKYAQAMACILMFMIGAPLGAIIKKGGIGMPTIIAILFFIIYYIFTSIGEKSAKEDVMNPYFAVWLSDFVLLPFGLFFMHQARMDARIFDIDIYTIWIEKIKIRLAVKRKKRNFATLINE